jgi:hypothetical protein
MVYTGHAWVDLFLGMTNNFGDRHLKLSILVRRRLISPSPKKRRKRLAGTIVRGGMEVLTYSGSHHMKWSRDGCFNF